MEKSINLVENYLVKNNNVIPINDLKVEFSADDKVLYEVIRVRESVPIFLKQHLERLKKSIDLTGLALLDFDYIKKMIVELLKANPVADNNIRISLVYSESSHEPQLLIYFIPSIYPTLEQKELGVEVKTHHALRENPNAKIENRSLRNEVDQIIKEIGCYEVLLVNNQGIITEGSRSNVFFIEENNVITPPIGMVLGGITRQMVISLANSAGIQVFEKEVNVDDLTNFSNAFLTGTSPSLLPISKIDDICFNVKSPLLQKLIDAYEKAVKVDQMNFKRLIR